MERTGRFMRVNGTIIGKLETQTDGTDRDFELLFEVEDESKELYHLVVTPDTYVVDFKTLIPGMKISFWFDADAPMLLIYPPRVTAAVVDFDTTGCFVDVDYYDADLVNRANTLKLELGEETGCYTRNNQLFAGNIANHSLVVLYGNSTRSIPAITVPEKIIVL